MAFRGWEKIEVRTEQGSKETAVAPLIISASRSTDIPAFFSDWLINRLEKGYCKWINPFNRKPQYVSFERTKVIVFWSKNPRPIMKYLSAIEDKGFRYYFQFTVNDYEEEGFEPNVPPLGERIDTFKELSENIGKEKVIWRFDPLILTDTLGCDELLGKISKIGNEIHPYTEKLVVSFADISNYAKVKRNLTSAAISWREFTGRDMRKIASGIHGLSKNWGLKAGTCGEQVDLSGYGLTHNKCIDDDLILRITEFDKDITAFLEIKTGSHQDSLFGMEKTNPMKDKGQRKECGCIVSKDIGQYNTCNHLCVYCYANTSPDLVRRNRRNISPESEAILSS